LLLPTVATDLSAERLEVTQSVQDLNNIPPALYGLEQDNRSGARFVRFCSYLLPPLQ